MGARPADQPLPFLPREVGSVELSELDLDGADADWFEANYPGPTEPEFAEPVAVKVDALLGRPLVRHGSDLLAHAVGHLSGLRAQQEVMLVNVLAELLDAVRSRPAGCGSRTGSARWTRGLTRRAGQGLRDSAPRAVIRAAMGRAGGASHDAAHHRRQGGSDRRVRATVSSGSPTRKTWPPRSADFVAQAPELILEDFTRLVGVSNGLCKRCG